MQPTIAAHETVGHEQQPVHEWRVAQLMHLGISAPLSEVHADRLDWHQVAGLVDAAAPAPGLPQPRMFSGSDPGDSNEP